jgi:hypothetical protein
MFFWSFKKKIFDGANVVYDNIECDYDKCKIVTAR